MVWVQGLDIGVSAIPARKKITVNRPCIADVWLSQKIVSCFHGCTVWTWAFGDYVQRGRLKAVGLGKLKVPSLSTRFNDTSTYCLGILTG